MNDPILRTVGLPIPGDGGSISNCEGVHVAPIDQVLYANAGFPIRDYDPALRVILSSLSRYNRMLSTFKGVKEAAADHVLDLVDTADSLQVPILIRRNPIGRIKNFFLSLKNFCVIEIGAGGGLLQLGNRALQCVKWHDMNASAASALRRQDPF